MYVVGQQYVRAPHPHVVRFTFHSGKSWRTFRGSAPGKIVRLINKFPNPPNKDVGEGLNTVVPLLYEGRLVEQQITGKVIDKWFEMITAGLTPDQEADRPRSKGHRAGSRSVGRAGDQDHESRSGEVPGMNAVAHWTTDLNASRIVS